jgi:hypothetical protein
MKSIRTNTIYIIFERLENFYDDNDSVYVTAFENSFDADKYVKKYPHHNYYVEPRGIFKYVK